MAFTETEILQELDLAFNDKRGSYYPDVKQPDIAYNFFPDPEHGYCLTAGTRIHLFADASRWALVFEKSGYFNRAGAARAELTYFGNCIDYSIDAYPERKYISNVSYLELIDGEEFERITNTEGGDMETFERIGKNITHIKVKDMQVPFESDYRKYEALDISIQEDDNPGNFIGFGELVRYLHETAPDLISATDEDIMQHLPKDIKRLMTVEAYHFTSAYDKAVQPSQQELYKLLARVLVTGNADEWKPTHKPNNHWSNWESGNL